MAMWKKSKQLTTLRLIDDDKLSRNEARIFLRQADNVHRTNGLTGSSQWFCCHSVIAIFKVLDNYTNGRGLFVVQAN